MKRTEKNRAFTLVEVMIVILIIGILLSIAIPQMMTARTNGSKRSCQKNQHAIDTAKVQVSGDFNLPITHVVVWADILPYLKFTPECHSGGTYDLGTVGTNCSCSLAGHPYP